MRWMVRLSLTAKVLLAQQLCNQLILTWWMVWIYNIQPLSHKLPVHFLRVRHGDRVLDIRPFNSTSFGIYIFCGATFLQSLEII